MSVVASGEASNPDRRPYAAIAKLRSETNLGLMEIKAMLDKKNRNHRG